MKFIRNPVRFGQPRADEPPLPFSTPAAGQAGGVVHERGVLLPEAALVVAALPAAGEAVHAVMTGSYDLMDLLVAVINEVGPLDVLRISTLSFSAKNLESMLWLFDDGKVKRLDLLTSTFFRGTQKGLWETTQAEFASRKQRAAVARIHTKVITLACGGLPENAARRYVIEGSANLRTNDSWEQFVFLQSPAVHDFHAAWIEQLVKNHEGEAAEQGR